ncbi:NUDIX domain-containing protein [Pseudonocardia sp. CA-107938]|uniref:NUDIX domain-containing protein n=1 Tax=Pseudonocardia sp. CA-107938 TaxID=3240021 RepID=UPI003D925485
MALYDADGAPTGAVAPRRLVYRDGLWHAATGVLLRSSDRQRLYLHRRTDTKLVHPGAFDCWAGGVVDPGETPDAAAARELAEELGVRGAPLTPLGRYVYDDGRLRYHIFAYEAFWDGPVTWQPEEVAWGAWITVAELRALLSDPARPFAPDGRLGADRWLARQQ